MWYVGWIIRRQHDWVNLPVMVYTEVIAKRMNMARYRSNPKASFMNMAPENMSA
jgi:hypothetical protein